MTQFFPSRLHIACAALVATLAGCQVSESIDGEQQFTVTVDGDAISSLLNSSASQSASASSAASQTEVHTLLIEEGDLGFCYADGDLKATGNDFGIETTHAGYEGMGYINTGNAEGAGIRWHVHAPEAGMFEAKIRYSLCCDEIRPATLKVNGQVVEAAVPFERTRSWETWLFQTVNIPLLSGTNTIEVASLTTAGLANIDSLTLVGKPVEGGLCEDAIPGSSSSSSTASSSPNRTDSDSGLGSKTLPCPSAEATSIALAQDLVRFDRDLSGGAHSWWFHGGEVGLAATVACGNQSADDRFMEQLQYVLTPGRGTTSPGGYADQHQVGMLTAFAVASRTPRIWNQLSASEQHKIELMMEAALVSNAFLTSDHNPFVSSGSSERAIDGDTNISRSWNPNFRNGNLGSVIVATAFFGPQVAQQILASHDHQAFIERLRDAELENLVETYTISSTPSLAEIESTLHQDYTFYETRLDDLMGLYGLLTNHTYGKHVHCGLNDGAGHTDSTGNTGGHITANCDALPNKGKLGMLTEFDSVDGNGPRSAASYAHDGLRPNTFVHYALVVLGQWQNTEQSQALLDRINVGANDLFYKLDPELGGGYVDYSKGRARGNQTLDDSKGHRITRDLIRLLMEHHKK